MHLGGEPPPPSWGQRWFLSPAVSPQQWEGRAIKFLGAKGDISAEGGDRALIRHNLKHSCHILNGSSPTPPPRFVFCSSYVSMTVAKQVCLGTGTTKQLN